MRTLTLFFACFVFSCSAQTTITGSMRAAKISNRPVTYYVDQTAGSDDNSGLTAALAWKTVAKVNAATLTPGQVVAFKRGETWHEQLAPDESGTAANPITFTAYGAGANPILDGTTTISAEWALDSGAIYSTTIALLPSPEWPEQAANMIYEDGTPLLYKGSLGAMEAGSYYYSGTVLYVWTRESDSPAGRTIEASVYPSLYFHGLIDLWEVDNIVVDGLAVNRSNVHGIKVSGGQNVTVKNSTLAYNFHNSLEAGPSNMIWEGLNPAFNPVNINFLNNTVTEGGMIFIHPTWAEGVCVSLSGVQAGRVDGNTCDGLLGGGIQVNGGTRNVTISNNYVVGHTWGIYISDGYWNEGDTENILVSYNTVDGSQGGAYPMWDDFEIGNETDSNINGVTLAYNVAIGGVRSCFYLGGLTTEVGVYVSLPGLGYQKNVNIYNNTCYDPDQAGIVMLGPTVDATINIYNNIFYAGNFAWYIADPTPANYAYDYNVLYDPGQGGLLCCWMGPGPFNWPADQLSSIATVQAGGKMTNSVEGNPLFTNAGAGDFTVPSNSPAYRTGVVIPGVTPASNVNIGAK